jgi:arginine/ornithine transport system substrate-binding protein
MGGSWIPICCASLEGIGVWAGADYDFSIRMMADSVNLDEGFLKTDAGKGFAFVGPSYKDAKYFGGGAGIAVRKGDKELADKFNTAITEIRANGKYKQVQDKYFDFDVYGH